MLTKEPERPEGCPDDEALDAALSGGASPLAAHIDGCEACQGRLERIREDRALLGELADARREGEKDPPVLPPSTQSVDEYELIAELHRGGQGVVYKALQKSTNRVVAFKMLLRGALATQRQRLRFDREIDLASRLQHPNIAAVYASGVTPEGQHFLVMELIEGRPLDEHVRATTAAHPASGGRGARAALERVLGLHRDICNAVAYAHQRGVIHRDLKPANILVDDLGRPHILDFGLAKSPGETDAATLSRTGEFLGTVAYASPEQARGDHDDIDIRSDVYSLGVMLYELLTGRSPYPAGGRLGQTLHAIAELDPSAPSASASGLPLDDDLDAIVFKAMAKDPARRYQSADGLARDLSAYLAQQPIEAKRDSRVYVLRKFVARHRWPVASGAAALVVLTAFGVAMAVFAGVVVRQRDTIRVERDAAVAAGQRAKAASEVAQHQKEVASRTSTVLYRLLTAATPLQAQGKEVTLLALIDSAGKWIGKETADYPEVEASVRTTLGFVYERNGRLDKAAEQLERALQVREALGRQDQDMAETLTRLAEAREASGDARAAEPLVRRGLAIRRRELAHDDPRLADALSVLGRVLNSTRRYDDFESVARELHQIRLAKYGPRHVQTFNSLNFLAVAMLCREDLEGAERAARAAAEGLLEVAGEGHPSTAASFNNLAVCLNSLGRYAEAEGAARRAMDLSTRVLGADHVETCNAAYNLALALGELARYGEAEAILLDIHARLVRQFGAEHPLALKALTQLSGVHLKTGRIESAEAIRRWVAEASARVKGPSSGAYAQGLEELARVLIARGGYVEAESLCRAAIDVSTASHGPDDRITLRARCTLGDALAGQGRRFEAEEILRATLDRQRACLGETDPDSVRTTMGCKALALGDVGRSAGLGRAAQAAPGPAE